jgi:hypothetical protein
MNVLTLLALTFAIAFVAPAARYVYRKWLADCWHSTTAAVRRGGEKAREIVTSGV